MHTFRRPWMATTKSVHIEKGPLFAGLLLVGIVLLLLVPANRAESFDYGQTGGGALSGTLTVTVVDGLDGSPVEGAWVMVGPEANSPFTGNFGQTGAAGQIVFIDGSLSGPQTVTAAKDGYRVITLVDVDAAAVTLPLELFTIYDPADPPVDAGIIVQGDVTNFTFVNNNGYFEVGIVRDTMDIDMLMDFDVQDLFGPAVVMTIDHPTYGGNYYIPRNVVIPSQTESGVTLSREPYMRRLVEGGQYSVFALKGQIGVTALLGVLSSGAIGQLLGAMVYNQFGMANDFTVTGAEPMVQDVDLTKVHAFAYRLHMAVSNLPTAPSGWGGGYGRGTFLLSLADMDDVDGSGRLALVNLALGNTSWNGGLYRSWVFPQDGVLSGSTYLGMAVASALDSTGNPDSRMGISGYLNRAGVNVSSGVPGVVYLDEFYPFVNQTTVERTGDRILLFYWAWEGVQEGVDYIRCDLDAVARVDCVPCDPLDPGCSGPDCPAETVREYRDTNWTVLLPGSRLGFYLPALPPGAPRALGLSADEVGVSYKLDWKLSEYGLGWGAPFDFDNFVFSSHRDRVDTVTQKSTYFTVTNRKPDPPWNVSPVDGQTAVSTTPMLEASVFSDQDADSVHAATQWQVSSVSGSYGSAEYDSGEDSGNLTTVTLPEGVLGSGTYYWHVRYKDDGGKWSDYSAETFFETGACTGDEDCDDGDVCTGTETCVAGSCQAGTPLVCDDGKYCNGTETCDSSAGCQPGGGDPCTPPLVCDEGSDACVGCVVDGDCDDADVCTGTETCVAGSCQTGTPLVCDDGDVCNGTETCDATAGCQAGTPLVCDDGDVCNGTETCDATAGCQAGTPLVCDDGKYCNGTETCDSSGGCQPGGGDPCTPPLVCNEDLDSCVQPDCNDQDGDGFGSPASPSCSDPRADCDDDATDDPAGCDTCSCGETSCAGCAVCINPGAQEFSGDAYDSNCNGNADCFIATASFGTEMVNKIDVLRDFRDQYLIPSKSGRAFVDAYYKFSPPVADYIAEKGWLKALVRTLLLPVVGFASLFL